MRLGADRRSASRSQAILLQLVLSLVVAAGAYIGLTLPPKAVQLPSSPAGRIVSGGYHVHTDRSDGTGTPDAIAEAAARAGLQFVIFTDHGDGTRPPDPPQYRHGVLCIDAVEINTAAGHLVALGLEQPTPYPFAGEARDVVEDVHRLGGWTVVAHPDSPKPELRWRAWNVDYDGIEWLNADSEWRDETALHLVGAMARYLIRSPETIASLFERPARTLQRWDGALARRPVVGLAALDTHARLAWADARDERGGRTLLARPNYVEMFRTVSQAVTLDQALTGDARVDGPALLDALRRGHTFSVVTAIAHPGSLRFTATRGDGSDEIGEGQSLDAGGPPIRLHAIVDGKADARVVLLRNGTPLQSAAGSVDVPIGNVTGAYRVEAYYPGRSLPWLVSNPIYISSGARPAIAPAPAERPPSIRMVDLPGADQWNVEHDPSSTGTPAVDGRDVAFRYALGGGRPAGQFAAVVTSLDPPLQGEGFDRVVFTVRADRAMRVSVQLRMPAGREGQRWRHSVYADSTPRAVTLSLQDFLPVEPTTQRPLVAHIKTVLFVVDTVNTSPGSSGTFWLSDVKLGVGDTGMKSGGH